MPQLQGEEEEQPQCRIVKMPLTASASALSEMASWRFGSKASREVAACALYIAMDPLQAPVQYRLPHKALAAILFCEAAAEPGKNRKPSDGNSELELRSDRAPIDPLSLHYIIPIVLEGYIGGNIGNNGK